MKVKDLILKLQNFDPEMEVMCDDEAGGYVPSEVSIYKLLDHRLQGTPLVGKKYALISWTSYDYGEKDES